MLSPIVHIGIDVCKPHLDICCQNQHLQIPNTAAAIKRWLRKLPAPVQLICESSGGYEAKLLEMAHQAGCPVVRVNARQVRDFAKAQGRLAKTDRIDAKLLSDFGSIFKPDPMQIPAPVQQELAALLAGSVLNI